MGRTRVIDTLYFRGLESVKVIFDVEKSKFKALVFDKWVYGDTFGEVKDKVFHEVEVTVSTQYTWVPIIEVKETGVYNEDHAVGFEVDRLYVAIKPDGRWLRRDWEVKQYGQACQVFKEVGFTIPSVETEGYGGDTKIFYLKYEESTWENLQKLGDAIDKLRGQLRKLLGTQAGRKLIALPKLTQLEWKMQVKGAIEGQVDG